MAKASPSIRDQTNQLLIQNQIQNQYYNEITDDAFEGYESEKEAVLGEPDKSINIVEDDIATDLEEVTGFFYQCSDIIFPILGCLYLLVHMYFYRFTMKLGQARITVVPNS